MCDLARTAIKRIKFDKPVLAIAFSRDSTRTMLVSLPVTSNMTLWSVPQSTILEWERVAIEHGVLPPLENRGDCQAKE